MAAVIDTSSATTAEGQLLQLLFAMNGAENANLDANGAVITNNVQITPNAETDSMAVNLTLPVTASSSANGVTYAADTFLP